MHESSSATSTIPAPGRDVLTEILRDGAQRLLGQAIEAEVDAWIDQHTQLRDEPARLIGLTPPNPRPDASIFRLCGGRSDAGRHVPGLAARDGPESCVAVWEGIDEALTGARTGRAYSRETNVSRDADAVRRGGRQQGASLLRPGSSHEVGD